MRLPRAVASLLAALGVLCAVALLATPGLASAQLVFDHGNDIWAANDDGSNPHLLVQAAPLGMDAGLGSPAVAPDGDTLLFRGTTLRNPRAGLTTNFYGANASGDYELAGGVVRRLSGPPTPSPEVLTSSDEDPEPAPGGAYVYEHDTCTEGILSGIGFVPFCKSELRSSSIAAGAAGSTPFATPCDATPEGGPADPSPDPAGGSLVVYVGCEVETEPFVTRGELTVGEQGGGGTAIAYGSDLPYEETVAGFAGFADPSWSPDGSRIVAYDYGGTDIGGNPEQAAGIYEFDPATPGSMRLVVSAPLEPSGEYETLASPRFAGPHTIVFVAGGSVWSVPEGCEECSLGSDATKLVPGGSTPAEQAFSVAWTKGNVAPADAYPSQGQDGGSPPSGGPGPPTPPAPPSPRQGQEGNRNGSGGHGGRLALTLARVHAPRLRKLLAKGLPVKARCSRRCALTLTLTVDAKTARRYGLARHGHAHGKVRRRAAASLLLRGQGAARHRGRGGAGRRRVVVGRARLKLRPHKMTGARVCFTRKARHALRHARRLNLRLTAVAHARGARTTRKRTVRVKR